MLYHIAAVGEMFRHRSADVVVCVSHVSIVEKLDRGRVTIVSHKYADMLRITIYIIEHHKSVFLAKNPAKVALF